MVLTHDQTEAEDLVQETYLRAMRAFDQLVPDSNLKSWLLTIMRNTWLNQLRHATKGSSLIDLDGTEEGSAEWLDRVTDDPHIVMVKKMELEELGAAIESLRQFTGKQWCFATFLLIASVVVALFNVARNPKQRTVQNVSRIEQRADYEFFIVGCASVG